MKKFVVLYVGLILGLALLYPVVRWATGERKAVRIYPSLAAMIPADTRYAVGFRVERLKTTSLYKGLVEGRRIPLIEDFVARTGLDPRKSIYEIVLVSNGQDVIALAGGKFSQSTELRQGLEPPVKIEGDRVTRMTYQGYTLEGNENAALCFLNSATAMAGPAGALRSLIDRRQANPQPPAELLAAIDTIPAENHIWAVATGDVNQLLTKLKLGLRALPFEVKQLRFEANVADGLRAKVSLDCPDVTAAEQLAAVVRGAQAFVPKSNAWSGLYDQLEVRQENATVHLQMNLSAELLEKLLGPG
jgi:hypothetical protein